MMIADQSRKMLLGGKWVEKEEKINVFDPQDNSLITTVPKAGKEDMLLAIKTAEEGREIAKKMTVNERINVLNRTDDYMVLTLFILLVTLYTVSIITYTLHRYIVSI